MHLRHLILLCLMLIPLTVQAAPDNQSLDQITLPAGFEISLYAQNVPGARSMTLSDSGVLYIGTRYTGRVYAVRDLDGDFYAEDVKTIASGYVQPNGVAFYEGALYVADIPRIVRFDDIDAALNGQIPAPVTVTDFFPPEQHHNWRYLAFGSDDKLYVSIGSPCDLCLPNQTLYGRIVRMNPDGTEREDVAYGIRNTVGFDWHPETGELWFTDNGPDYLGNDVPADELNRIAVEGSHFGFPFCHAGEVEDRRYGVSGDCDEIFSGYVPPVQQLGPHVAALGMKFYAGEMFPEEYVGQIFIAEHGSVERNIPIGYRVTLVRFDADTGASSYEPFAEGWLLNDGSVNGRPVDVLQMPDGSLLVSDDYAGVVYRITYTGSDE